MKKFVRIALGLTISLLVTCTPPVSDQTPPAPMHEGSVDSPVTITPDVSRDFFVGAAEAEKFSYYSFTTGQEGVYYIDVHPTCRFAVMNFAIFADSAFTAPLKTVWSWEIGGSLGSLSASTTYYLRIENRTRGENLLFQGIVASPGYQAANYTGEGSAGAPVQLTIGSARSCCVGKHSWDMVSYYTFTTGSQTDYSMSLAGRSGTDSSLGAEVYSDAAFTSQVDMGWAPWSSCPPAIAVFTPNTTYFMSVRNLSSFDYAAVTFSSLLTPTSFAATQFAVSDLMTTKTLSSDYEWYEVPVSPNSEYAITLSDSGSNPAEGYTCDVELWVFEKDRSTQMRVMIEDTRGGAQNFTNFGVATTVYLQVRPLRTGQTGTFGIRVAHVYGSLGVTVD